MKGKDTCKLLKRIRRDIAAANDISLTIADCKYQGDCSGTCPRCESEVRALERALDERRRRGLKITLAGISAGLITTGMVSCETPLNQLQGDMLPLEGAVPASESTELTGTVSDNGEYELDGDITEVTLQGDIALPETTAEPPEEPVVTVPPPIAGKIAAREPYNGEKLPEEKTTLIEIEEEKK